MAWREEAISCDIKEVIGAWAVKFLLIMHDEALFLLLVYQI